MEVRAVELAAVVQTPRSVHKRDVGRALDAVCEQAAQVCFCAQAGQALVDGGAVGLLGWRDGRKRPAGE